MEIMVALSPRKNQHQCRKFTLSQDLRVRMHSASGLHPSPSSADHLILTELQRQMTAVALSTLEDTQQACLHIHLRPGTIGQLLIVSGFYFPFLPCVLSEISAGHIVTVIFYFIFYFLKRET